MLRGSSMTQLEQHAGQQDIYTYIYTLGIMTKLIGDKIEENLGPAPKSFLTGRRTYRQLSSTHNSINAN